MDGVGLVVARSVAAAFDELLARQRLTDRQVQVAQVRVETLGEFFKRNFTLRSAAFPIGSYARGTMCAGERDIDVVVPFEPYGQTTYWERYLHDSSSFLYFVRDQLNEHYAATDVSSKRVAVTLDFNDIVTDVVPAFPRKGGGLLIPNGNGGWKSTNPPVHTELINQADQLKRGRLKPMIKLLKAWNIANGHHLQSFHLELMVESMWRSDASIPDWPSAMADSLRVASTWVLSDFKDPWPEGNSVSQYLSARERDTVVGMLESDAAASAQAQRYAQSGIVEKAFERWAVVYRHTFPAHG
jgi:hypothetical protein